MSITAYVTSLSRSCRLSSGTTVNGIFDIGFTFVNNDGIILNNGISLSTAEVPDGVIIAVDPYGRIIGKIPSSVGPDSPLKLVLDYNGSLFDCDVPLIFLLSSTIGALLEFTKGGGGGGGGVN